MHFRNSIVLCIVLSFAACDAQDVMTPQQLQDAQTLEKRIEQRNTELDLKGNQADVLMKSIGEKIARGENVTEDVLAFKRIQQDYEDLLEARNEEIEELNQKYSDAVEERTGGITGVVKAIPVIGPYAEFLALLIPFAFPRPRQLAKGGLKYLSKGQLWQAFLAIPKILGMLHTSNDPKQIALNAATVAEKKNQTDLANKIQEAVLT